MKKSFQRGVGDGDSSDFINVAGRIFPASFPVEKVTANTDPVTTGIVWLIAFGGVLWFLKVLKQ